MGKSMIMFRRNSVNLAVGPQDPGRFFPAHLHSLGVNIAPPTQYCETGSDTAGTGHPPVPTNALRPKTGVDRLYKIPEVFKILKVF